MFLHAFYDFFAEFGRKCTIQVVLYTIRKSGIGFLTFLENVFTNDSISESGDREAGQTCENSVNDYILFDFQRVNIFF